MINDELTLNANSFLFALMYGKEIMINIRKRENIYQLFNV